MGVKKRVSRRASLILAFCMLVCILTGCGGVHQETTDNIIENTQSDDNLPQRDYAGLAISELMYKNKVTVRDENGEFHDWIELYNAGEKEIDLSGAKLSDGAHEWTFPDVEILPGEYLMVFFGGRGMLHASFSLSEDDELVLTGADGETIMSCRCEGAEKEESLVCSPPSCELASARYPTPGFSNDADGYKAWQESLRVPDELCINEAFVCGDDSLGTTDWVELFNAGVTDVLCSEYTISDDPLNPDAYRLPDKTLAPGEYLVVRCDKGESGEAPFALNSEADRLILSKDGYTIDALPLRGIPAGGSIGRELGHGGWFYYEAPTQGVKNQNGARRVSSAPALMAEDGVFNDVDGVAVEMLARGVILYTTDASDPKVNGMVYVEPFTVKETCVIRAYAQEDDALPSEENVFTYIINEGHTLPVVSLCVNREKDLENLQFSSKKLRNEVPATLSYYEDDRSFSIPCGVNLSGAYSVTLKHKSFKIHFRSAYGEDGLRYDLFDDGIDEYSSLTLRKGQDSLSMVFRTELWEDICRSVTDKVLTQNSRFCVLYLNGEYYGICSLREDFSKQFYASRYDVSKSSVEWEKSAFSSRDSFVKTAIAICCETREKMTDEQLSRLEEVLDIDSVIDWMIVQGVSGNSDFNNNVAVFRSSENGNRWQMALFDMDHSFEHPFYGMFGMTTYQSHYISVLCKRLCTNEQFTNRLMARYAELWDDLSEERILAVMDKYEEMLAPEIDRDFRRWNYHSGSAQWEASVEKARHMLSKNWCKKALQCFLDAAGIRGSKAKAYFAQELIS